MSELKKEDPTASEKKVTSRNSLDDFVKTTGIVFCAITAGGFLVLTLVGVQRTTDRVGRLVGIGLGSAPLMGFLGEVWKTKKNGEQFIASRKKEVDEQIFQTKEEFNEKLTKLEILIKEHINQPGHVPLEHRVTALELANARLKAEVQSATQTGKLRDTAGRLQGELNDIKVELVAIKSEFRSQDPNCTPSLQVKPAWNKFKFFRW